MKNIVIIVLSIISNTQWIAVYDFPAEEEDFYIVLWILLPEHNPVL
jgi:hypothetical protein